MGELVQLPTRIEPRPSLASTALLARSRVADNLDDYVRLSIPQVPYQLRDADPEQTLAAIAESVKSPKSPGAALGGTYFGYREIVIGRREENRRRLRLLLRAARTEADDTRREWVREFLRDRWSIPALPTFEREEWFVLETTEPKIGYRFELRGGGE